MDKPRLKVVDWKQFDGKELVIYWERDGHSYIGRVSKVKLTIEGEEIMALLVTIATCFQIHIRGDATETVPKSKQSSLQVQFGNPGPMTYGLNAATIVCPGCRLSITNDPEDHEMFLEIEGEYTEAEELARPKPAHH